MSGVSGLLAVLVVLYRRLKGVHIPLGVEEPGFKCSECREKIHGGRPVVYLLAADNSQV